MKSEVEELSKEREVGASCWFCNWLARLDWAGLIH